MISTKTIVDKANTIISGSPTEDEVRYLSVIGDSTSKAKLTVATTSALPAAADNEGRLVYVSGEDSYYFSDGTEWLSDFSSELQTFTGIYSFGYNLYGRLADDTTVSKSSPVTVVGGINNWSVISAGDSHGLGITDTGVLYAWGLNGAGQAATGVTFASSPVTVIGGITNWSDVSGRDDHSLGIANGIAYAWGSNSLGRLGDDTTTSKSSPVTVIGNITNWSAISAGNAFSIGIAGGIAYAWGGSVRGQLGDDSRIAKSSPVTVVGGITNWSAISAGYFHSVGIAAGIAYAWGENGRGELGDGTTTDRSSPVTVVGGITNWSAVSAGTGYFAHTLGLTDTGVLYGWGTGNNGRIGNGILNGQSSPVTVLGGITNWSAIAAGAYHSLGITDTGVLYAWGENLNGRLGDGTETDRSSPVTVVGGITSWSKVSAGQRHSHAIAATETKGFNEP